VRIYETRMRCGYDANAIFRCGLCANAMRIWIRTTSPGMVCGPFPRRGILTWNVSLEMRPSADFPKWLMRNLSRHVNDYVANIRLVLMKALRNRFKYIQHVLFNGDDSTFLTASACHHCSYPTLSHVHLLGTFATSVPIITSIETYMIFSEQGK
jgi:hypothetical protein